MQLVCLLGLMKSDAAHVFFKVGEGRGGCSEWSTRHLVEGRKSLDAGSKIA